MDARLPGSCWEVPRHRATNCRFLITDQKTCYPSPAGQGRLNRLPAEPSIPFRCPYPSVVRFCQWIFSVFTVKTPHRSLADLLNQNQPESHNSSMQTGILVFGPYCGSEEEAAKAPGPRRNSQAAQRLAPPLVSTPRTCGEARPKSMQSRPPAHHISLKAKEVALPTLAYVYTL